MLLDCSKGLDCCKKSKKPGMAKWSLCRACWLSSWVPGVGLLFAGNNKTHEITLGCPLWTCRASLLGALGFRKPRGNILQLREHTLFLQAEIKRKFCLVASCWLTFQYAWLYYASWLAYFFFLLFLWQHDKCDGGFYCDYQHYCWLLMQGLLLIKAIWYSIVPEVRLTGNHKH